MPAFTICPKHSAMIPPGAVCARCASERSGREAARRDGNNQRLGRYSRHWGRVSRTARHRAHGVCPDCGGVEDVADPGSKLTADLVDGGDHRRARLADVRVSCRRCHGLRDGARR